MRDASPDISDREAEDPFDDIKLNEEAKPKRKGLFSRRGDDTADRVTRTTPKGILSFAGRRRGKSIQGAELKTMETSSTDTSGSSE